MKTRPRLQWVKVDSEIRHISDFRRIPAKRRPDAFCPCCEEQVTLKLGPKKAAHAAHRTDAYCALTSGGETMLHIRAKYWIAEELRTRNIATVMQYCHGPLCTDDDGPLSCQNHHPAAFASDWDEIKVESWVNRGLRPDVSIIRAGKTIAAVEVLVHHIVDANKERKYADAGIPWAEVVAARIIPRRGKPWSAANPLPSDYFGPKTRWICDRCQDHIAATKFAADNGTHLFASKILDIYWPEKHERTRYLYQIFRELHRGKPTKAWLECATTHRRIKEEDAPIHKGKIGCLANAFVDEKNQFIAQGAYLDSPMGWWKAEDVVLTPESVATSYFRFPPRYSMKTGDVAWIGVPHTRRWNPCNARPAENTELRVARINAGLYGPREECIRSTRRPGSQKR